MVLPDTLKVCCVLLHWRVGRSQLISNAKCRVWMCLCGFLECGSMPGQGQHLQSQDSGCKGGALESLSSSITSWFLLMKTSRQNANAFQGTRSGFVFFSLCSVKVSYEFPCEVFVPHLSSSVTSPRLMALAGWCKLFFLKDEKHVPENISQLRESFVNSA